MIVVLGCVVGASIKCGTIETTPASGIVDSGSDATASVDSGIVDAGVSPSVDGSIVDASVPDATIPPDAAPPAGTVNFLAHVPGAGRVTPVAIDVSEDGTLAVVAGYYSGSLLVTETTSVVSSGSDDMFVSLLSISQNSVLWTKTFGGVGQDRALGVAFGAGDDVVIAGRATGNVTMGSTILTNMGGSDIIVARLSNMDGDTVWARDIGGAGFDEGFGLATDSVGNALITGYFNGPSVNFGDGAITASSQTIFVAKYAANNGALQWVRDFGAGGGDSGLGIAVDAVDDVVVTGVYEATVPFDSFSLTSAGARDVFVVKLTSVAGDVNWARSYGGTGTDRGWEIATGGSDRRVSVVGYFGGVATIGGNSLVSIGSRDVFVLSLTASGNPIWAIQLDHNDSEFYGDGIAVDINGDTLVTGRYLSGTNFGDGPVVAEQGTDMFVGRWFASSGALDFLSHWGGTEADSGMDVTADPQGNVYAAGYFGGTTDFEVGSLTTLNANADGVVIGLRP